MGTHPNTLIMAVLTLDQGSRKTKREMFEMLEKKGIECDHDEGNIKIKNGERGMPSDEYPEGYELTDDWSVKVMEEDYDEGYQISAKEGQIVVHDFVTYGYGQKVSWKDLEAKRKELIEIVEPMSKALEYTFEIYVGANYW